jgi:hypothetical protein
MIVLITVDLNGPWKGGEVKGAASSGTGSRREVTDEPQFFDNCI